MHISKSLQFELLVQFEQGRLDGQFFAFNAMLKRLGSERLTEAERAAVLRVIEKEPDR